MLSYYRGAVGVLITYDITSRRSYDNLDVWLNQVKEFADPKVVIMLVGNKCDLSHLRTVPREEAQKYAGKELLKWDQLNFYNFSSNCDFIHIHICNGDYYICTHCI